MTSPLDRPTPTQATIVVVPCFNEAQRLNTIAIDSFLARRLDVSLLFVDDGSTDDTPLILERIRQRNPRDVCTLRLSSNFGKAEAVRRGVQLAIRRRAEFVGYWDADLATPLEAIPRFRAVLQDRPDVQLVLGSRVALLGRQIRRRWRRHMLGRAFATAASCVLGLPVYDTQCGAKLFRVVPETTAVFREPFHSRWIFDVEILARLVRQRTTSGAAKTLYEYPLESWQEVGGSRLSWLDFLTAVRDLAAIHWRNRARAREHVEVFQSPPVDTRYRDAA